MEFKYSSSQLAFKQKAREFITREMAPEADDCDRKSVFPKKTFSKFGRDGFLGVIVPEKYGGLGLGTMEYCLLSEELGRLSAGYHHNNLYQTQKMILHYGTEEQKQRFLPGLATGKHHAATAISEPEMGSSFANMQTIAKSHKDGYIVNGIKSHINDAAEADVLNLFAKTDQGVTIFLLEKDTPGFNITRKLDPMGLRASPIYEFELKDCHIPKKNKIGQSGQGVDIFISTFNFSRLGNASVFLGTAKAALESAVGFAMQRKIGEKSVTDFQGIRWMIADLYTKVEAAELLRNKGVVFDNQKEDMFDYASMAKLFCGEVATEVVMAAIKITGSYGCYRDKPFERWLRDVKALEIAGGTPEIMKNIVANKILKSWKEG